MSQMEYIFCIGREDDGVSEHYGPVAMGKLKERSFPTGDANETGNVNEIGNANETGNAN